MRLIDADNLKNQIEESISNYYGEYTADMINMWGLFAKIIDETSTVDPDMAQVLAYESGKASMEHPLFAPMMYDVTSLPDIESADCITNEIRKYQDKIAEDTEMWLICEMAKMYMQGVQPHYEVRRTGKWIMITEPDGFMHSKCDQCNQLNGWGDVPFCPWCGAKMVKGDEE